jgi:hypothetical protein
VVEAVDEMMIDTATAAVDIVAVVVDVMMTEVDIAAVDTMIDLLLHRHERDMTMKMIIIGKEEEEAVVQNVIVVVQEVAVIHVATVDHALLCQDLCLLLQDTVKVVF